MNAKGDANRSVRLTKQRLYQALITLLQQKSLREITVRELTELAGISRGTFYFHYADIYALMDQMEATQLALHPCGISGAHENGRGICYRTHSFLLFDSKRALIFSETSTLFAAPVQSPPAGQA